EGRDGRASPRASRSAGIRAKLRCWRDLDLARSRCVAMGGSSTHSWLHAHRRRVPRDRLCAKGVADGTIARVAIVAASVRERLLAGMDTGLLLLPISTASGHVRVLLLRQEGVVRRQCRSSAFRGAMLAGLEPHGGRWDWGGSVAQRDLFDA